jgi:hypothetical protein
MKALSIFATVFLFSTAALKAQTVDYVAQNKDFCSYTSLVVDVSANIEIDIRQSSSGKIVGSEHDLANIRWEVKNGELTISAKAEIKGPLHITLGGAALTRIESTSESIIYLHHLQSQRLQLDMLKGSIKMEGHTEELVVMAETGKVYGSGLEAKRAEVKIWDGGSVLVNATDILEIEATNNGKVLYHGSPLRVTKTTGTGGQIISQEELNQQTHVEYVNFGA